MVTRRFRLHSNSRKRDEIKNLLVSINLVQRAIKKNSLGTTRFRRKFLFDLICQMENNQNLSMQCREWPIMADLSDKYYTE